MLWTSTIVTVREKHDKTVLDVPLGLSGSYKLVDHGLSAICEITKLCLPKNQRVWACLSISVFKSENSVLSEVGVGCDEASCLVRS